MRALLLTGVISGFIMNSTAWAAPGSQGAISDALVESCISEMNNVSGPFHFVNGRIVLTEGKSQKLIVYSRKNVPIHANLADGKCEGYSAPEHGCVGGLSSSNIQAICAENGAKVAKLSLSCQSVMKSFGIQDLPSLYSENGILSKVKKASLQDCLESISKLDKSKQNYKYVGFFEYVPGSHDVDTDYIATSSSPENMSVNGQFATMTIGADAKACKLGVNVGNTSNINRSKQLASIIRNMNIENCPGGDANVACLSVQESAKKKMMSTCPVDFNGEIMNAADGTGTNEIREALSEKFPSMPEVPHTKVEERVKVKVKEIEQHDTGEISR